MGFRIESKTGRFSFARVLPLTRLIIAELFTGKRNGPRICTERNGSARIKDVALTRFVLTKKGKIFTIKNIRPSTRAVTLE